MSRRALETYEAWFALIFNIKSGVKRSSVSSTLDSDFHEMKEFFAVFEIKTWKQIKAKTPQITGNEIILIHQNVSKIASFLQNLCHKHCNKDEILMSINLTFKVFISNFQICT